MDGYGTDLSYIHDVGFSGYVKAAAPALLETLRRHGIERGLVVDLGCGSGVWAEILVAEGFDVLGIDLSPAMIGLARRRVPQARFEVGSLLRARLPVCGAVTSIGECLNYAFDRSNSRRSLARLFARVHRLLRPGGIFAFDIAEPGQPPAAIAPRFVQTEDWSVLVKASEEKDWLIREITAYRRTGKLFRRTHETHRLRLFRAADLCADLASAGFSVGPRRPLDAYPVPPAHAAIVASKPGRMVCFNDVLSRDQ